MAEENRAPSTVIEFGADYDLKSQKVGLNVKVPTSLFQRKWSWFEVPVRSWRLRWRARGDAKRNVPPTNSDHYEDHETQIVNLRKSKMQRIIDLMHDLIQQAREGVTRAKPKTFDEEIFKRQIGAQQEKLEQFFGRELKRARRRWEEAKTNEERALERLERFVERNNLDRDADDKPFSKALALMLVAFLIDGIANATLFAGASEMGLLGGLVIAFALSAVNIAVGFIVGLWGVRNAFHINIGWRVAGGIVIVLGLSFGLFLNLFVAHFRDVAEASIAAANSGAASAVVSVERIDTSPVLDKMLSNPLALHTLLSYLLLASGLIVFIVGVKEGYDGFGDPYPGYGAKSASWKKAKKKFEDIDQNRDGRIVGVKANVLKMLDNARIWFDRSQTLHEVRRDDIEAAVGVVQEAYRKSCAAEERINEDAARLLSVYTRENRQFRTDPRRQRRFEKQGRPLTDPPARFDREPQFESLVPPIAEVEEAAEKSIAAIDANLVVIRNILLWIADRASTASNQLENLQAGEKDGRQIAA